MRNELVIQIRAVEAAGKNKLSLAFAKYIGKCTGIEINDNIVQTNRVHSNGKDKWYRFVYRPFFNSAVIMELEPDMTNLFLCLQPLSGWLVFVSFFVV